MNPNMNPTNPMNTCFWNPIELATALRKTSSFEDLTSEEKLQRRVQKIEEYVKYGKNFSPNDNNKLKYSNRMIKLVNSSPQDMKYFYEESPNYLPENMFDALIWLSYSEKEKKDILDEELDEYYK